MRGFLIGTAATAITFAIVAYVLPQIDYGDNLPGLIVVAIIAGVVNGFIKPIIKLFSLPLTVMTLGLFGLVINAGLLLLIAWLSDLVGVTFTVGGFPPNFEPRRDRRGVHRWHRDVDRRLDRRHGGPRLSEPDRLPEIAEALLAAARRFGTPLFVTDLASLDQAATAIRDAFPDPIGPAVLGQGERRPGRDRGRRGARVRGERRVARRMDPGARGPASRTIGSPSRGSARPRPTCARRSGRRRTARRWRGWRSNPSTRPPPWPRAARRARRATHRRPLPGQPRRRSRDPRRPGGRRGRLEVRDDRDRRSARPSRSGAASADRAGASGRVASTCTSGRSSAPSTPGARPSARAWPSRHCGEARSRPSTRSISGGGFPVRPLGEPSPTPERFARELPALLEAIPADRRPTRLAIEPGRTLVARAGWLVARVLHVRDRGGRQVILDAGMTELIRPALYGARHPDPGPRRHGAGAAEPTRVEGPICESTDSLGHARPAAAPTRRPRGHRRRRRLRGVAGLGLQRPTSSAAGPARDGRRAHARPAPGIHLARLGTVPCAAMDARTRFRERLATGPILADGAMGTLLFSRGIPQRASLDELVATRPDLIGADPSRVPRCRRRPHRDGHVRREPDPPRRRTASSDQAGRFARRGAQIAREARDVAGRDVLVAGSIGPLGAPTPDVLRLDDAAVRAAFRETDRRPARGRRRPLPVRDVLVARPSRDRHRGGARRVRGPADRRDADLRRGRSSCPMARRRSARPSASTGCDVDVVGVNCGAGPQGCLDALDRDGRCRPARSSPTPGSPSGSRASSSTPPGPTTSAAMTGRFVGCRCGDRRRLLRDDPRSHRGDAGRPRCG